MMLNIWIYIFTSVPYCDVIWSFLYILYSLYSLNFSSSCQKKSYSYHNSEGCMKNYFEISAYMYFILDRISNIIMVSLVTATHRAMILFFVSLQTMTFNFHVFCKYLLQWMKIRWKVQSVEVTFSLKMLMYQLSWNKQSDFQIFFHFRALQILQALLTWSLTWKIFDKVC